MFTIEILNLKKFIRTKNKEDFTFIQKNIFIFLAIRGILDRVSLNSMQHLCCDLSEREIQKKKKKHVSDLSCVLLPPINRSRENDENSLAKLCQSYLTFWVVAI